MITPWDVMIFGVAFAVFFFLLGFIYAATKDLMKWVRKKRKTKLDLRSIRSTIPEHPNCRCTLGPLLNKDMTDSGKTLGDLVMRNPLDGMSFRPMTPEELKREAQAVSFKESLVKHFKIQRERYKHEQLVMELGDDVLKGYTPGDGK